MADRATPPYIAERDTMLSMFPLLIWKVLAHNTQQQTTITYFLFVIIKINTLYWRTGEPVRCIARCVFT